MQYASNAVLAKARAMYAGHITFSEYENLIASRSLGELVGKLKHCKRYAGVLEKATPSLTAIQIEELLKMSIFEQLSILCRYEKSSGKSFYKYYIVKKEIEQILKFLRLLISGRANEYLADLPPFFNKLTELNLIALSEVRSIEELLLVLRDTSYRKILEPFAPVYSQSGVYLRIEAAFNEYRFKYLTELINSDKSDKKQLSEVLRIYLDSEFIKTLYRLKKMGVNDEKIYDGYFSAMYTGFSKQQVQKLTAAADVKEFMRVLYETAYGEPLKGIEYGNTEKIIEEYVCEKYIKGLRFYTDSAAILICYMYLADNEVMNIIRITEGVRYGIDAEKILNALTGVKNDKKV